MNDRLTDMIGWLTLSLMLMSAFASSSTFMVAMSNTRCSGVDPTCHHSLLIIDYYWSISYQMCHFFIIIIACSWYYMWHLVFNHVKHTFTYIVCRIDLCTMWYEQLSNIDVTTVWCYMQWCPSILSSFIIDYWLLLIKSIQSIDIVSQYK